MREQQRPESPQQRYEKAREQRRGGNAQEPPPHPGNGSAQQHRFTLKPFKDITICTTPSYLVKGVLPRSGLAVVWGPPKCGKSFWTFDLVMHIATGRNYRGRRVQGALRLPRRKRPVLGRT
jgi:hypothetical protein